MPFSRNTRKIRKRQSAWLYSVVFNGALSMCLVLFLLLSFLIQPVHKALAAEPVATEEPPAPVAEDVAMEAPEEPVIDVAMTDTSPEDMAPSSDVEQPFQDDESGVGVNEPEEVDEILDDEPDDVTEPVVTDDSGSSDDETLQDENTDEDEDVVEDESDTEKSEKPEQVVQVEGLVNEDNFYQFSKQSCVAIGDGTYHCSSSTESEIDQSSVVYADRDAGGDMEIFLKTSKNKIKQLTDNDLDDTSPHYDPESMRVVWQRLIDGRNQIILFDIMEDNETQLTYSKTNNMEPKVSDGGIVWQAWDSNDWEIMLFDGVYTEQLTQNEAQDVVPVVQDGYVLWNVLGGEEQQARVYSLETRETISIVGHEGGSIVNPRFVLVYDTQYENGDIVTQSLDPKTGLSEPIAAKPAPEPVNIPDSDPIGEIRALITSSKSKDEKQLLEVDSDGGNNTNASSTEDGALNLKQPDGTQQFIASTTVDMAPEFELTEYDLVIPENALEEALLEQENTQ